MRESPAGVHRPPDPPHQGGVRPHGPPVNGLALGRMAFCNFAEWCLSVSGNILVASGKRKNVKKQFALTIYNLPTLKERKRKVGGGAANFRWHVSRMLEDGFRSRNVSRDGRTQATNYS